MPDTYSYFVIGYSALLISLFGLFGFLLKRLMKLEKDFGHLKGPSHK